MPEITDTATCKETLTGKYGAFECDYSNPTGAVNVDEFKTYYEDIRLDKYELLEENGIVWDYFLNYKVYEKYEDYGNTLGAIAQGDEVKVPAEYYDELER